MGFGTRGSSIERMRIGDALQAAIDRARRMLFEPFNFERWLLFGIVAFLDVFLAGGGASRFGSKFSTNTSSGGGSFDARSLDRAVEWLGDHIAQILLIGLPLAAVVLAIHVALLYVGCRGQLMFVRSVSLDGGQIGDHWGAVKRPATSLFYFRLALLGVQVTIALVVFAFALIAIAVQGGIQSGEALLFIALPFAAVFILSAICLGLIRLMLRSFVVPLMWAYDLTCLEAWGAFASIARENLMPLLGFVLVKIAYSIGFSIATVLVGCVTCCVGWLPVVHHTIFAPFYVFDRAFSMELLAMTGDDGRAVFSGLDNAHIYEVPPLHG